MSGREIYASSNGDSWTLVKSAGQVSVIHKPNDASGGAATTSDLVAFLSGNKQTPQGKALLDLIGTLAD